MLDALEAARQMSEPSDHHATDADQLSLFGEGAGRMEPAERRFVPDTELIRRRLHALLVTAREAKSMPWPERDARMWLALFPQMADWLPDEEANQLRFEFMQEIERLKAA